MIAILRGIKNIDYTKKDTGERKQGIELHCERKPYPGEGFEKGSDVVFTQYIPIDENSKALCTKVLAMELPLEIDLVYVQNGRFSNLVDVNES